VPHSDRANPPLSYSCLTLPLSKIGRNLAVLPWPEPTSPVTASNPAPWCLPLAVFSDSLLASLSFSWGLSARISFFLSHTRTSICVSLGTWSESGTLAMVGTDAQPQLRCPRISGSLLTVAANWALFLPPSINGFLPRKFPATKQTTATADYSTGNCRSEQIYGFVVLL